MRIEQLIQETNNQGQLDELDMTNLGKVAGSVAGKTAQSLGAVAGGVKGAWDAAKAGFQQGKGFVSGQRVGGGTAPTSAQAINQQGPQGTAPAQNVQGTAGTAVQQMAKATQGQKPQQVGNTLYSQLKGQVGNLDKGSIDKMINLLQKLKAQVGKAQPAQNTGGAGAFGQMAQQMAAAADAKTAPAQQAAPAQEPAAEPAAAPTQQAAPAPAAEPAPSGKLTPQQIAAKKAELQGRRAAGNSTATATGSGFKNYVAGSGERLQGADAQGNPVFKKIAREGTYQFESKFLGGWI